VWERHSCRQNLAVSSVKLCQVGIEHRHKVQLEELCCEFRQKPESLKDSVKLYQVGIEPVQGVHKGRNSAVSSGREPESLRILRALPGGHRASA
jgi:hypothetical protein